MVRQVHKADVLVVSKKMVGAPSTGNYIGEFDGLVTNCPDVTLAVFTADCCPVLLYDENAQVVGALHCGWKPLCADIIFEGIKKMESLGAKPENISAGIGPCINQCCFETGPEVVEGVKSLIGAKTNKCFVVSKTCKNKFYVNLRKTVQIRLVQLGVPLQKISNINECTSCNNKKYFSYRAENGKTGRLANIIKLPDKFPLSTKNHKNDIPIGKNVMPNVINGISDVKNHE